jgi:hypothetical protein
MTGLSRAQSFIQRIPEEVPLASVAEHHDESDTAVDTVSGNRHVSLLPDGSFSPAHPYIYRPKINGANTLEDRVMVDNANRNNAATVVDVKVNSETALEETHVQIVTPVHSDGDGSVKDDGWLCCGPCRRPTNCCEPAQKVPFFAWIFLTF